MFSSQGSDEGCGKWLSTKNTRRIGQLVKQKNARGATKVRKKQAVFKTDHLPGVVISSTPMSPRIIEMLSRVKQAKVERLFKPVASRDKGERSCESEVGLKTNDGGIEVLGSYKTPILKRQHKMTTDLEELQLWEDDDITSSERHEDETDKLNISGVLSIEKSDNSLAQELHHPKNTTTNQDDSLMNSSPDDTIKSPVSKKFRCMTNEPPISPSSLFADSLNDDDDDDKDSDSFHFTQWVDEQKRKLKELQGNNSLSSQQGSKLESHARSSSSSSCELNRKFSQDIGDEIFSDTESQFCFSQWALEQKAKCKSLQNDLLVSAPKDTKESLHKNLLESKSSSQILSDPDWTESNFQFTEWVKEQKTKSKEIQHSSSESKQPSKSCDGMMTESINENVVCIRESEVFEEVESGKECGWQYQKNDSRNGKTENINEKDDLRYICRNPSFREVLKDVSNGVMCDNGTSSRTERKHPREPLQNKTEEESDNTTCPSQESEYFQYTEWTRNQMQICRRFHKDPEFPVIDDFWEIPEKNDIKSRNDEQVKEKQLILASDTDQESDSET